MKIDKEELSETLRLITKDYPPKTSPPETFHRYIVNAFQSLIEKYPEIILFEQFKIIILKTQKPEEIATLILYAKNNKARMAREDADASYSRRKSKRYKGRKKSEIWDNLKMAHEILSLKHIGEWERDLGINKKEWVQLSFKVSECLSKQSAPMILWQTGEYKKEAINRMMEEHLALWGIYDFFKTKLEEAIKRNDRDDKTFVNTVKFMWGEAAKYILPNINNKSKGRKISENKIIQRIENVKKYALNNEMNSNPGRFYRIDMLIWLSFIAYTINGLLSIHEIVELNKLKKESERLKTINNINYLVSKFDVKSYEVTFHQPAIPFLSKK